MLRDSAHDALLTDIKNATRIVLCSQDPTTFTEANVTYMLGYKDTPTLGTIANGDASGRKFTISAITDGTVDTAGTATHYALVDVSGTALIMTKALSASKVLAEGSPWETAAFDIENPDPS